MTATAQPNIGLKEGYARGDNGWEGDYNLAMRALDALVQTSVKAIQAAPPASPANGDCYIVATSGTGAWAGWDGRFVRYRTGTGWESWVPSNGWYVYNQADSTAYRRKAGAWVIDDFLAKNNPNFTGSLSQGGVTRIASNGDGIFHAGTVRGNGSDTIGSGPYWQIDNYPTSPAMAWLSQLGADNGLILFHSNNGVWSEKWRYMQDGSLKQAGAVRITAAGGFRGEDAKLTGLVAGAGYFLIAGSDGGVNASDSLKQLGSLIDCLLMFRMPPGSGTYGSGIWANWVPSTIIRLSDDTAFEPQPNLSLGGMWLSKRSGKFTIADGYIDDGSSQYRGQIVCRRWSATSVRSITGTTAASSLFAYGTGDGTPNVPRNYLREGTTIKQDCAISVISASGTQLTLAFVFGATTLTTKTVTTVANGVGTPMRFQVHLRYAVGDNMLFWVITGHNGYLPTENICWAGVANIDPTVANAVDIVVTPASTGQTINRHIATLEI